MVQAIQHFKLLMYMKKPKPWRRMNDNDGNRMRFSGKARNVDRICRQLMINSAPSILLNCHTPRNNKKKCQKRKAEPPFLIRTCIKGHENWEIYMQKIQRWTQKAKQKKQNNPSTSSSMQDQNQISYSNTQLENVPAFTTGSITSTALLRTFYTVWHIGRISRKSLKTNEEGK
ncbi:hypothetical protein X798_04778 [Onchocerca flexuosa]|uniref:Uncharacterized protein n=1 Tax=Onchocerca flexuosa TaxID=387005 RepID=A0A238BS49_9BILA|nr:hypothetical protein X798_04778 [Onchocerca flexuosa]